MTLKLVNPPKKRRKKAKVLKFEKEPDGLEVAIEELLVLNKKGQVLGCAIVYNTVDKETGFELIHDYWFAESTLRMIGSTHRVLDKMMGYLDACSEVDDDV